MIFKNDSVFHCSSKVVYLILNYLSFFLQARNVFENTVYKAENYYFLRDSIEEFFICTVLYGTRFPYRFHLQFIVFSLPFTKLKWNKLPFHYKGPDITMERVQGLTFYTMQLLHPTINIHFSHSILKRHKNRTSVLYSEYYDKHTHFHHISASLLEFYTPY